MSQPGLHRLLQRQIRGATPADRGRLDLSTLLQLVSAAYRGQEAHRQRRRALTQATGRAEAEARIGAAEARFQTILANCPDAVIGLDEAGAILVFNPAAERLFGRSATEVLGAAAKVLFNVWGEQHLRILDRLMGGPPPPNLSLIARRWDGGDFPAAVSFCKADIDGAPALLSFWRDMTDHEAARRTLIGERERAEAANRAKSEFLAAMSHEIRTPLNGVLGMAGALAKTELTDPQRRMIEVINDSGEALHALLSDILDLSKIEAGLLHLESGPFDLGRAVRAVAELYGQTARDKGLGWRVEISARLADFYLGDSTRVRQILQNLIANAVKFTQAGEVRIVAEPTAGDRGIRVSVWDTGIGMDDGARARLFSRFVQADSSTSLRFGGAGLGLAICRDLARAMGGEVFVESRPDEGSRFWLDLPLARTEGPAVAKPAALVPNRRFSLLAVDDNANNRLVLQAILSQVDADLAFAANGQEAVTAASERPFDVILMDVQMPVMDGLVAARAIRSGSGPCRLAPIVALTADAMPRQVQACREAGMDAHVVKPIRPDILLGAIQQALLQGQTLFRPASGGARRA